MTIPVIMKDGGIGIWRIKYMNNIFNWASDHDPWMDAYSDINKWPRWLRRLFILTFPISVPIYFLIWMFWSVIFFSIMVVGLIHYAITAWW